MSALPQPPFGEPPRKPFRVYRPGRKPGWEKFVGWILAGLVTLIVLVVVAVAILLHSSQFHAYILRTAQEKATAALGSKIELRNFGLHLSLANPVLDVYGATVYGVGSNPTPPLLQADELHLELTITSLLRRSWYVKDIRVEHPVVHVIADRDGKTNLPESKSSSPSGQQNEVFDLGIRHLLLERGELYYNDLKSALDADVHDLTVRSAFHAGETRYDGNLSYQNGRVRLSSGALLPHALAATFSATPQSFTLTHAELASANSRVNLSGQVTNYAKPQVQMKYDANLDFNDFRKELRNPSLPEGTAKLEGVARFAQVTGQPAVSGVTLNGTLASSEIAVPYQNNRVSIRDVGARYSVSRGDANVSGLHAALLGGMLHADLVMRDITGKAASRLSASLRGVSVTELQKTLVHSPASRANVRGTLDINANASWVKALENLVASADATLQASVPPQQGTAPIPVTGVLHGKYLGASQQLTILNSYLRAPQSTVNINGTVSKTSALQIQAQTNQLRDLENLLAALRMPASSPLGLYGQASLTATLTGSTSRPTINAQLTSTGLKVHGTSWKAVKATVAASPSGVQLKSAELDPASKGKIVLQGSSALSDWSPNPSAPFQVKMSANNVNAGDLAKAAGMSVPVAGTLSADVDASGTQMKPAGHGTVRLATAKIGAEPVRDVNLQFEADGVRVNGKLQVSLPSAGSAAATFQYQPSNKAYVADVTSPGIQLDQLQTVQERDLQVSGTLHLAVSGRGTLDNPQLQAEITIPELRVRDQRIENARLQTTLANHEANFSLDSAVFDSSVRGRGNIHLTGDYPANVNFDTQGIPLAPLVAIYAPSQAGSLSGQTELHGSLRGPLKDKAHLEAHLVVPQLSMNYKNTIQLAAAAPIRADYRNGVLDLQRSTIKGTDTEINFQAHVPAEKNAPISLLLKGGVDLRIAQLISPDITSGGQLQFDVDSFGSRSNPDVQGQIKIVNASFATVDVPVGLQAGNGVLTLTRDRLNITQFYGKVGGGDVTASGGVLYRPGVRFDLGMTGKGVRVLYAQSVRTTIDSDLSLSGNLDSAELRGQVGIAELSFTPGFDLMSFASEFGGAETPPPPQGLSQNVRLNVNVVTPGGLNLSSRTLSVAGNANLQVHGTAAEPVILGRLNLNNGDLIFNGNRYLLQAGTIDFRNPSQTQPVLDMAVNTKINQYDIQMRFWGPADHLHTNYASDPGLPPSDIINLIAFGKTSEAAAANPTPPGSLGAESLVASQVSSQVTNRVEKLAGISQLSIDPVLGDTQQSTGARVAVQQRVTSKVFVTFSTDVTATQQQIVKFEYQWTPRTSFNAVRDQNGGFSFLTSFRKQW